MTPQNFFDELIHNRVLVCAFCAWTIAQIVKCIIYMITHHELRLERLFGDGGMPSGHSATVTAAAVSALWCFGIGSFEFAITFIFAIITMHDAMGVRLETGKQAVILNEMMEIFTQDEDNKVVFHQDKLKEFVGHTPIQVVAGSILGCIIAIVFCSLVH